MLPFLRGRSRPQGRLPCITSAVVGAIAVVSSSAFVSQHCMPGANKRSLRQRAGGCDISSSGFRMRRRQKSLHRIGGTVLHVLGDYKDTDRASWDEEPLRPPELDHSSFDIHDLLLQRALQTQSRYFRDTRNDLQADWMLGFLNHVHLGSGEKWHSVIGMRVHFTDYFRELMREPVHAFTVSVRQGVTEGRFNVDNPPHAAVASLEKAANLEVDMDQDNGKTKFDNEGDTRFGLEDVADVAQQRAQAQAAALAETALGEESSASGAKRPPMTVHPDLTRGWQQAAASRARNPYLQKPCSVEYTDYVQPREVAHSIMRVCRSLSTEWLDDLDIIANEDNADTREERVKLSKERRKFCKEHPDEEECAAYYDDATPPFEQAERSRAGDSTPLRRLNFELLQRSVTILGIKSLQTELAFGAMSEKQRSQELVWFDTFVESWWAQLAGVDKSVARGDGSDVALDPVSEKLFDALELSMPTILKGILIDPQNLSERLHSHRERSALQLARQLKETDAILENLVIDMEARAKLERAM